MPKDAYIPFYRWFKDHYLWKEKRVFSKAEAWLDICSEVHHDEKPVDVTLGMEVFVCNEGESLKSILTWAKRWGWTKSRTGRYLNMLKKRNAIELKSETVTTRLKVLDKRFYKVLRNGTRNASETQTIRERNASETQTDTDNNVKNVNNEKKEQKKQTKKELEAVTIFEHYLALAKKSQVADPGRKTASYHSKAQAQKNILRLLKKEEADSTLLLQSCDNYFASNTGEMIYKCSNFFGQAEYWRDFKEKPDPSSLKTMTKADQGMQAAIKAAEEAQEENVEYEF